MSICVYYYYYSFYYYSDYVYSDDYYNNYYYVYYGQDLAAREDFAACVGRRGGAVGAAVILGGIAGLGGNGKSDDVKTWLYE